jgi:hypothetical protein
MARVTLIMCIKSLSVFREFFKQDSGDVYHIYGALTLSWGSAIMFLEYFTMSYRVP